MSFQNEKESAFVINAAPVEGHDEDALLYALNSGHLAGAGLDVFVSEPNRGSIYCNTPKFPYPAHLCASTAEAQEKVVVNSHPRSFPSWVKP